MTSASQSPLGILDIVDLPRNAYHVLPPRKWQVAITLAGIVAGSILWGLL